MGIVTVIPALLACLIAVRHSTWRAYLDVYIPVLLLLPMYYRWVLPVLPDPTFEQATILPIAGLFLAQQWRTWKFSGMDLGMGAFAGCIGYSEYLNAGYKEAQNLMFDMIASVVLPYVLTKQLVALEGRSVAFARRIVLMLVAVSIISIFEFRTGVNPWSRLLSRFFPGQGWEWVTSYRYGFTRIAGPYAHAILAGLVLAVAFRLHRWLEWTGEWGPQFRWLRWTRLSKARLIMVVLIAGIVMTMVRGPWLGGVAGGAIAWLARSRNRQRTICALAAGLVVIGIPAAYRFYAYASVGRAHATEVSQETAAYRVELIDKYVTTAKEGGWWGYGRNTWPRLPSAPSIDNHYLLLWLMHGRAAVSLFIGIVAIMFVRLMLADLRMPVREPLGGSLGFTLAGLYLVYAITLATVYMGMQAIPLFAIVTGWSEGYLLAGSKMGTARRTRVVISTRRPLYSFKRVVA